MAAAIIEIADAVLAALLSGSFSQSFVAKRVYVPKFLREEIEALQVTVRPAKDQSKFACRGIDAHTYGIEIGITQGVPDAENATLDPLTQFTQDVAEAFGKRNAIPGRDEVCLQTDMLLPDPEQLQAGGVFQSLVTLTIQGVR
ncbi:hypothetical protein BH11PLA2_BH11PLA2_34580 [soil metagenome]